MTNFPTFFSFDVETTSKVASAGELLTVGCVPVVRTADGWVKYPQHFYMEWRELAESIPPAYTEWLAGQFDMTLEAVAP